jgi:hypothetical protein
MIINDLFNNKKFVAESREIYNKKGRFLGTWDGFTFTMDPDAQAWATENQGPEWIEQFVASKTEQLRNEQQNLAMELQNSDMLARREIKPKREYYELAFRLLSDQQGVAEEVDSPLITDPQYTTDMQPARAGQKGTGLKAPREYIPIDTEKPVQPPALGIRPTSKTKVPNFEPKADFDPKIDISPEEMNDINQQIQQQNLTKSDDNRPMRFDVRSGKMVPVEPEQSATRSVPVASVEKSNAPDPNARWVVWDPKTRAPAVAPAVNKKRSADSSSIPANPKSGSWQELAKLNNITDPRKLQANSWIKTPSGEIYVNKGDTLSGIAQKIRAAQRRGVSEEESEAAALRKQYPSYYQYKDAGTIFRTQNDAGQRMDITPDDEEWDDYYRQQFPDMSTPNDEIPIRYNVDGTAVMVEGSAGKVVFSGQGANGSTYEIIQSRDGFMIHANGRHIDTYGSLQRAMSVLKNEVPGLQQGMAEDDGFNVVSNTADMRTTDTGNKHNSTYTSTTVQKNPTTGQQVSLSNWDHTDPATGKRYVGSNYIDKNGNVETQKNYQESKKTKVDEVSLGDYRKKAQLSQATSKIDRFFGRDDPEKVARADQTIAKRERGMARAAARVKPYTAPPVDQDKQRRDLADKYPDIDELVRQAELNRDPNYEYADGQAYYNGRDAEHKYHKLKQIQRMIRGAELDEMDFGGVQQTTDSANGDVTTSFNQGPISVTQTKTPGGYTKQTDQRFDLGPATIAQKTVGPNLSTGQLAGTTTKTATNNMTGQSQQQVKGVGFGGASGATVGKNYVGSSDDELARHAADSLMGTNESVDRMKHLAGIKSAR